MAKSKAKLKVVDRPDWQSTYGTVLAGQSEIDEVDLVRLPIERRWGCGRLRLLVGPELREKFDRQRYKLNQAIWHGGLEDVRREAKRMIAAWQALDRVATEAGAEPLSGDVWEIPLADGTIAALVRDPTYTALARADGRVVTVYTLEEIGRLLLRFPELFAVKEAFSGATVVAERSTITDPLDRFNTSKPDLDEPLEW